jgi:hypothetical protein
VRVRASRANTRLSRVRAAAAALRAQTEALMGLLVVDTSANTGDPLAVCNDGSPGAPHLRSERGAAKYARRRQADRSRERHCARRAARRARAGGAAHTPARAPQADPHPPSRTPTRTHAR